MLVSTFKTAQRHNSENRNQHVQNHAENIKSDC
jgi:hypothetical protein